MRLFFCFFLLVLVWVLMAGTNTENSQSKTQSFFEKARNRLSVSTSKILRDDSTGGGDGSRGGGGGGGGGVGDGRDLSHTNTYDDPEIPSPHLHDHSHFKMDSQFSLTGVNTRTYNQMQQTNKQTKKIVIAKYYK